MPGTAAHLIVRKLAAASPSCGTFKSFSFYLHSSDGFIPCSHSVRLIFLLHTQTIFSLRKLKLLVLLSTGL